MLGAMADYSDSPVDKLWAEYGLVFRDWDDLTLARWMCQTLGQVEGRVWRMTHPLLGAYRLAAQLAHERQVWFKRLVTIPATYVEAPCCRAPLLPLLTRDVAEGGLVCQHCGEVCQEFSSLPGELGSEIQAWTVKYQPVHAVAHWDDRQRQASDNYEGAIESAAREAEQLLAVAGGKLAPKLLEFHPAVVWEDQDECLEVRPEDIDLEE
jgi:hypothetical protein